MFQLPFEHSIEDMVVDRKQRGHLFIAKTVIFAEGVVHIVEIQLQHLYF